LPHQPKNLACEKHGFKTVKTAKTVTVPRRVKPVTDSVSGMGMA
jgi:hypothetical protein